MVGQKTPPFSSGISLLLVVGVWKWAQSKGIWKKMHHTRFECSRLPGTHLFGQVKFWSNSINSSYPYAKGYQFKGKELRNATVLFILKVDYFWSSEMYLKILSGVDFKWPTRNLMRVSPRSFMRASLESLGEMSRPRSSTPPSSSVMWRWCMVYGHSTVRVFWVVRSLCAILFGANESIS